MKDLLSRKTYTFKNTDSVSVDLNPMLNLADSMFSGSVAECMGMIYLLISSRSNGLHISTVRDVASTAYSSIRSRFR